MLTVNQILIETDRIVVIVATIIAVAIAILFCKVNMQVSLLQLSRWFYLKMSARCCCFVQSRCYLFYWSRAYSQYLSLLSFDTVVHFDEMCFHMNITTTSFPSSSFCFIYSIPSEHSFYVVTPFEKHQRHASIDLCTYHSSYRKMHATVNGMVL